MPVSPSGTDERQVAEYLDSGCKLLFRGIYNKQGRSKVDCFDVANNTIHQCIKEVTMPPNITAKEVKDFKAMVKKNVARGQLTYTGPQDYYTPGRGGQPPRSARQAVPRETPLLTDGDLDFYAGFPDIEIQDLGLSFKDMAEIKRRRKMADPFFFED